MRRAADRRRRLCDYGPFSTGAYGLIEFTPTWGPRALAGRIIERKRPQTDMSRRKNAVGMDLGRVALKCTMMVDEVL